MASVVASAGASAPPPPPPPPRGPAPNYIGGQEQEEEEEEEEEGRRRWLPEENTPYKPKPHIVWQFFSIPEGKKKVNAPKVTCLICNDELSRGNPNKKYSFGNYTMIRHMTRKHPNNYSRAEFRELASNLPQSSRTPSQRNQPTSSQPETSEVMPCIQPRFADFKITCTACGKLISYGEQSVKLIVLAGDNHKCPKKK